VLTPALLQEFADLTLLLDIDIPVVSLTGVVGKIEPGKA
jgi:hypothetical protein